MEALKDGRVIVPEKEGKLRVVTADGRALPPIAGIPQVDDSGQGGLLDVAIAEGQDGDLTLCITYSEPRENGKNATAAACATATGSENLTLSSIETVFQQAPAWESDKHYSSRFLFASNDIMWITTGERSNPDSRHLSQDKSAALGKVIRLKRDGDVPSDNPFAAEGGVAAQVWSFGHRNIQSAALDAQGRLWTVEHGPRGGDELNCPEAGKNNGRPVITYGEDYSGSPIGAGSTKSEAAFHEKIRYTAACRLHRTRSTWAITLRLRYWRQRRSCPYRGISALSHRRPPRQCNSSGGTMPSCSHWRRKRTRPLRAMLTLRPCVRDGLRSRGSRKR